VVGEHVVSIKPSALDFEQIDLLVTDLDPSDRRLDGYRDLVKII